jgi:hypothetical protein
MVMVVGSSYQSNTAPAVSIEVGYSDIRQVVANTGLV